jgi:hypothetical protein
LALAFMLHLLVRRVKDATLPFQRKTYPADKKWNGDIVHKEIPPGDHSPGQPLLPVRSISSCSGAWWDGHER